MSYNLDWNNGPLVIILYNGNRLIEDSVLVFTSINFSAGPHTILSQSIDLLSYPLRSYS